MDHLELNDFRRKRKYFTIRRFRRQSRNGPHLQSQGCHHHHRRSLRHRVGHRYHRQYHLHGKNGFKYLVKSLHAIVN